MEKSFLNEMPKFKTPDEELAYLREHVAKREQALIDQGHFEHAKENAITNTIVEYKQVSVPEAIHQDLALSKKEAEGIVLKLKPETHDVVMEELLGLVITKGVRNALEVAESMGNPHVDDDFHRLLIQYIKSGQYVKDFKEGTPLYKALNMTLFEITLPPSDDSSKGFKEFIGAMEQFYAGMQSIGEDQYNKKENYFTLEVALANDTDHVVIFASVPNKYLSLFEKQVLSFYHDAKIHEVEDDYNIFNEEGGSVGAYAAFAQRPVLPIKTYDQIDHDPMNTILNVFSKLKTKGEGAAIQLVIAPAGDKFINEFHMILDDVKEGKSVKYAADNYYKFKSAAWQTIIF